MYLKYFEMWTLSMNKICCCNSMQPLQVWEIEFCMEIDI